MKTYLKLTIGLLQIISLLLYLNERWNSILMTRHYPDLGSASDWSCRVGNLIQPIRSTTRIWVVTRHQYGISLLVSRTSFGGETSGRVWKCRLFSHVTSRTGLIKHGVIKHGLIRQESFFLPIQNSVKNDTTWKSIVSWMLGYFLTMFNDFLIF